MKPIFDTQLAHKFLGEQAGVSFKYTFSYNYLCFIHDVPINDYKDKINYKKTPAIWAKRPFTTQMINYASADVRKVVY